MTEDERRIEGVPSIEQVASGQKLIISAIVVNVLGFALNAAARSATTGSGLAFLGAICGLAALALAIVGLLRLGAGLGYSTPVRVVLIVLAIIPLINLVMLVIVNARATNALRAAGYKVGLFGASR